MNGTVVEGMTALQAAREARGVALVVAARASGLLVSQAEALERGDVTAFASADEMMAAAGVYAEALGISREEVVGLLDQTVSGPVAAFSDAVKRRSAESTVSSGQIELAPFDQGTDAPALTPGPIVEVAPVEPVHPHIAAVMAADVVTAPAQNVEVPVAAAPQPAFEDYSEVADATGEIPMLTIPRGELESWAEGEAAVVEPRTPRELPAWVANLRTRATDLVGDQRTERAGAFARTTWTTTQRVLGTARERMRSNEHATLVVALMGGLVLLATLLAIGSAMGTDEPPTQTSSATTEQTPLPPTADPNRGQVAELNADAAATASAAKVDAGAAKKPAKPAVVPPGQITVNVLNAGRTKGLAAVMASKLKKQGYRIGEVKNSTSSYSASVILIPSGLDREAQQLMKVTGITTLDSVAQGGSRVTATVIVK